MLHCGFRQPQYAVIDVQFQNESLEWGCFWPARLMLSWLSWWKRSNALTIRRNTIVSLLPIKLKGSKSRKMFRRCVLGLTYFGTKERSKIGFKKAIAIPNSFRRRYDVIHNIKVDKSSYTIVWFYADLCSEDHPS